jgi:hypothetical protein
MANDFDSNFSRKLMEAFLTGFESERVLSKNVDTQLFNGKFNPSTGESIDIKRPTDYRSVRTPKGDVSGETASDILTGKATATVQDYFTTFVDYDEADEALKMNQLTELLAPMATRMVTDFETDYARFMMENSALLTGTVGTAITTWDQVAEAGALMSSSGIPQDGSWKMAVNPFTQISLASDQRSLGGETGTMTANERATITKNFAGMQVMTATTLASYTTHTVADRVGAVAVTPADDYATAKDSMTMTISVSGFGNNLQIRAGETVTVTAAAGAVNRLNLSTRDPILDATGSPIVFSGTVTTAVTLSGTGTGSITITGPAISETLGQYDTVTQPILITDVLTLGGALSTIIQPNLFWQKQAFTVASVPIKKLNSVDTVATTKDGLQFRVSKGSDFLANEQKVRIDFRPAYGVMNQFFAGQAFGS